MTEWVAWVDVLEGDDDKEGARARYYVTHGLPFLQLTAFRTAAARYSSEAVARKIADLAADAASPRGVEQLPKRLTKPQS